MSLLEEINLPGLIVIKVPGDGSCMIHSILLAFYKPYRNSGCEERRRIAREVRRELATILPERYKKLSKGSLEETSVLLPSVSLESLTKELDSDKSIGYVLNEFISDVLDKDIYIINGETTDVYRTATDPKVLFKKRNSIVLLYEAGHYDLLGVDGKDSINTLFTPDHEWITRLRERYHSVVYPVDGDRSLGKNPEWNKDKEGSE